MKSIIKCPYYYFDKAIPDEMLNMIIALGESKEQADANVEHTGPAVKDKSFRQGTVAWIEDEWVSKLLESYAQKASIEAEWFFNISGKEHVQFATYEKTDYYNFHRDMNPNSPVFRKISVTAQLTDPEEYEGGDFEIKNLWGTMKLPIDPEVKNKGTILVFPSMLLHRVTPVTKGKRQSLVQWYNGPDFV